ncbi:hypothetical protein HK099_005984 [Clydaea vesicula]|uniref:Uncharacterized protein n=1 Tax=Clydaea vesicula TaxID=447962 RepID=A0AAD5U0U9_9FUNG|nr:hypothetical protein HK099_005984 [Clydaea vesicula]
MSSEKRDTIVNRKSNSLLETKSSNQLLNSLSKPILTSVNNSATNLHTILKSNLNSSKLKLNNKKNDSTSDIVKNLKHSNSSTLKLQSTIKLNQSQVRLTNSAGNVSRSGDSVYTARAAEEDKVVEKAGEELKMVDWKLLEACKKGDIELVYKCLWDGADVNCKAPIYKLSPLAIASRNGHKSVAPVLLEFKADLNSVDSYGATTIHWVAANNETELFKFLLQRLQKLNPSTPSQPLNLEVKKLLNYRDDFGSTALHFASVKGHAKMLELLLAAGCDPTIQNNEGKRPSEVTSDVEVCKFLFEEESKQIKLNNLAKRRAPVKKEEGNRKNKKNLTTTAKKSTATSKVDLTKQKVVEVPKKVKPVAKIVKPTSSSSSNSNKSEVAIVMKAVNKVNKISVP